MYQIILLAILCLCVTGCATYQSQADPDTDSKRHYIVKQQDNLHSIAFAFEITVSQLKQANPWLNTTEVATGMKLTIPFAEPTSQLSSAPRPGRFIWPLKRFDVSSDFGR